MKKIVFEFGDSPSKNYELATILARACSTYTTADTPYGLRHRVEWKDKDAERLVELYPIITGWRSTRFYLNDKVFKGNPFGVWMWCVTQRVQQGDKRLYCFRDPRRRETNPFGCYQMYDLYFFRHSDWLCFGTLREDGAFVFDKTRIGHFVNDRSIQYSNCPYVNFEWMRAFLEVFPASINPAKDKDWMYITEQMKQLSLDIGVFVPRSLSELDPASIIGVAPKDTESANYILRGIFAMATLKSGIPSPI